MLAAAAACADAPFSIQEEYEYDESRADAMAAQFAQAFTQFCASHPGPAGASAAAVQLLAAVCAMVDHLQARDEADEEGEEGDYDDFMDDGQIDDGDWRP
jgi:hypothetical protein